MDRRRGVAGPSFRASPAGSASPCPGGREAGVEGLTSGRFRRQGVGEQAEGQRHQTKHGSEDGKQACRC